jgi:hypothetical protein
MTHLPNELALKMDGAQAWYLYVARSKASNSDICCGVGGRGESGKECE